MAGAIDSVNRDVFVRWQGVSVSEIPKDERQSMLIRMKYNDEKFGTDNYKAWWNEDTKESYIPHLRQQPERRVIRPIEVAMAPKFRDRVNDAINDFFNRERNKFNQITKG